MFEKIRMWLLKIFMKPNEWERFQHSEYSDALEQSLRDLESFVHESDDADYIMKNAMKTALEFYQGDWIGFLEVDLELGLWTPTHWYNPSPDDKTLNLLQEFESSEFLHRWVEAMHSNDAIIVSDVETVKAEYPGEYAVYQRLFCQSVLAVPVKPRPMGFLVIRNPKRHVSESSMLQLLAFVVLDMVNEKKLMQSLKMAFSPDTIEHDTDIYIHLFGNLEIYTAGGVLREEEMKSPMCCRLLAYMLLNKKVNIPQYELFDVLWPEGTADFENPAKNLRSLVFRLRQSFGLISEYQLIETTTNGYRFNPKLRIKTDLELFDHLWTLAQQSGATSAKVDIMKEAVNLYKGSVLSSWDSDTWMKPTITHYELRYKGMVNELLKTLAEQKDFYNLHKYAAQAISVDPGNVKAYYWMVVATCNLGSEEMALTQLSTAEKNLTEEEYADLLRMLRDAKISSLGDTFYNEKLIK